MDPAHPNAPFADVKLPTEESLQSWKNIFPDPSTSPAHYTKALFVPCPEVVAAADAEVGGCITGFSRIVCLQLRMGPPGLVSVAGPASLVPLHRFSPVLKSLSVTLHVLLSQYIFDPILSCPLLEDLTVTIRYGAMIDDDDGSDWPLTFAQPTSPPMFTGSLKLLLWGGVKHTAHWLLSLPGGIHFRKFIWRWSHEEDILLMMALVERCSHTLESLDIIYGLLGKSIPNMRPYRTAHNCSKTNRRPVRLTSQKR